ncbi:aspartyl/asparaginyl beta-hydroxylase domain-containing protein [Pseudoalteromonas sp. MMG012]|uniref:aspartyl/asparaginyl beta-hydroxylase domain-containing protein n=1 Tax=Pseudoalteromonas sp. MMG012 TaxID=2822686 RepID=UPI001B3A66AD|nr:aspartyl/asparaginyl beta-hydroxylase domain-containing protein [Pseudoalteromonas sp. MMG012]MBQ4851593.1 aspartyl/asparaginyl beta-hydroxylase domain-containing protein [Pseudoalteromonas sp. MMG012]
MSEPILAFAQLDLSLEGLELSSDIEAAKSHDWVSHVNTSCYDGDWDVLPLIIPKEHLDSHIILQAFSHNCESPWVESQYLKRLPSIRALIARFECDVLSVRLMRLHPNSYIKPHRDQGLSLETSSQARIHIPLEISPEVQFQVDGATAPMAVNSVWYINADAEHSVKNTGDTSRINLVIDCNVNEWLFNLIMNSKNKTYCCKKVS